MAEHPIRLCTVSLLSRQPLTLDPFALRDELQKRCGQVKFLDQDKDTPPYGYLYLDVFTEYEDKAVPVGTFIHPAAMPALNESHTRAMQQSWDWEQARTIVPQCRYRLSIIDFMASNLSPQDRFTLMHRVILSVLELVSCDAIYWENSEHFTDPAVYQAHAQADSLDLLYGMMNIRLFRVEERQAGEAVMDSLGLHLVGLPDVQCHFVALESSAVAGFLSNVASYLFEKGDIIHDGEAVPGFDPDTRWSCRHEIALVGPEREVLDIAPSSPYAAGR